MERTTVDRGHWEVGGIPGVYNSWKAHCGMGCCEIRLISSRTTTEVVYSCVIGLYCSVTEAYNHRAAKKKNSDCIQIFVFL